MKKLHVLSLGSVIALALAGCQGSSTAQKEVPPSERLHNPLYAERYYNELTDRMVNMLIQEKDELKKSGKTEFVDKTRERAFEGGKFALQKEKDGLIGSFVEVKENTEGRVLLIGSTLYFSPEFLAYPGPALHIYLTTAIDPRDVKFPDPSAIDLGLLSTPYGTQEYTVPEEGQKFVPRSVVLYDTSLERIYSFAQLN